MDFEPTGFDLKPSYPNPFNSVTTTKYYLNKPNNVILKIYNLSGQEIETLVDKYQKDGEYKIVWQRQGILPENSIPILILREKRIHERIKDFVKCCIDSTMRDL